MHILHKPVPLTHQSPWERVVQRLARVDARTVAKSGSSTVAALLALSITSAGVSALRRRSERS